MLAGILLLIATATDGASAWVLAVPELLAGIGINVTSHVLIQHLTDAQRRFAVEAPETLEAEQEVTS